MFTDKNIEKRLKKSEVLRESVQLDLSINTANQCKTENKFAQGVCVECSKYYHIDDNNDIQPNQNYTDYVARCRASCDTNSDEIEILDFNENEIAPYSEQNLMTTNRWNDEAYDLFVESLTELEKMVLTPVHLQVVIVRLRTNNVPFSPHGVICYPLHKIAEAQRLPWFQFEEMPFLVMTWKNKEGGDKGGSG